VGYEKEQDIEYFFRVENNDVAANVALLSHSTSTCTLIGAALHFFFFSLAQRMASATFK
jgi:hypothetical protein